MAPWLMMISDRKYDQSDLCVVIGNISTLNEFPPLWPSIVGWSEFWAGSKMINLSTRSEQREKCKNMRRKREELRKTQTTQTSTNKQNLENIWKFVTRGAEWSDYYLICFLLTAPNIQQHSELNISHNHTLTTLNRADVRTRAPTINYQCMIV